ncbi:hypothetical protein [Microbulbifer sp. JMSA008]|uniref:hypothetical protein n=1 Tax=Microbulbifer sp. JMSA008 TaxID=3243373 RepID=UPI00403A1F2E
MAGRTCSCTKGEAAAEVEKPSHLLTVAICEDTLVDLLAQRALCAEALHCATPQARRRLRELLLRSLLPGGEHISPGRN